MCICGCVCVCAHVWVCIGAQVPQRIYGDQKTASLLQPYWSWGSNSGSQGGQQASLPIEPPWHPSCRLPTVQILTKYFRAFLILYLSIFHFQNINCWFLESVSFYLNKSWTKHLKIFLRFWLNQYPGLVALTLLAVHLPFSPALGRTYESLYSSLAQHCLLEWML